MGPRLRLEPDARRAGILAAATGEFAARPYESVAVAAIARAAGASEALVFKYFGTKASLYAAVVAQALADLAAAQDAAVAALPGNPSARDRVTALVSVYLDHVAQGHLLGAATDPEDAVAVRRNAQRDFTARVAGIVRPHGWLRHDYALAGFCGFLETACRMWAGRDCPESERHPLIDAALGCLEGALGDWGA